MNANIVRVTKDKISTLSGQIVHVYQEAFALAPYYKTGSEMASFRPSLRRHKDRSGFQLFAARDSNLGQIVGFAYGYSGEPGQWWHDVVKKAIDPQIYAIWMREYFELVELAVLPDFQRRGIGGALHDRLLEEQPHRRALLSTMQAETPAQQLYRQRGWVTLLESMQFPGTNRPYRIMGLDLADKK